MKKIFCLLVIVSISASVTAQGGKPDRKFGINGKISTYIGTNAALHSLALQPDGKILAFGNTDSSFVLCRFTSSGELDQSFGMGGVVTTMVQNMCSGNAVAVASSGKIYVAGSTSILSHTASDIIVISYNADGTLNPNFGTNGIATIDLNIADYGNAIGIQSDGKIVVSGSTTDTGWEADFITVRFNTDGTLDTGFGNNGIVITDPFDEDFAYTMLIQIDGKILVAGIVYDSFSQYTTSVIIRYNSDGSLDRDFSGGVVFDGRLGAIEALGIQDDGKIVAGGYFTYGERQYYTGAMVRCEPNGETDWDFGRIGMVTMPQREATKIHSIAVQPDGKICFSANTGVWEPFYQGIGRVTTSGMRDSSFGTLGRVLIPGNLTVRGGEVPLFPLLFQPDGKILAGTYGNGSFIIFRLLSEDNNTILKENISDYHAISIYPNPASERISIKGLNEKDAAVVTITDISGNIMKKEKLSSGRSFIDISHLRKGQYILEVRQENKRGSAQFIKQ